MNRHLSRIIFSALLGAAAAGFSFAGPAQAQTAGSLAVPLVATTSAEAVIKAEPVNHWKRRHYRRHHRHHPRHGGGGVYFNFGNGSFSLTVPPRRYHHRYQRPRYAYPRHSASRHVSWCYARYRSYRHWDNTFQPYHGPRKQCWSPYN